MKKALLLMVILIGTGLALAKAPVFADTTTDTTSTTNTSTTTPTAGNRDELLQQRIQSLQTRTTDLQTDQQKEASKTAQRCVLIEQRIDTALNNYQNNRQTQIKLYQAMSDRIEQVLLKLQAAGVNVSTLQSDLQQYNVKIQQLNSDAAAAMAQLQVAKQYECGNSQGQFMTELEKARTMMQTVEKDAMDVRSYFQATIRPDITALRAQVKSTHEAAHPSPTPLSSPVPTTGAANP